MELLKYTITINIKELVQKGNVYKVTTHKLQTIFLSLNRANDLICAKHLLNRSAYGKNITSQYIT